MEFTLLGNKKTYPESFEKIAAEFGTFVGRANDAFNNFTGIYQSSKNLNEVIYYMQGQAIGIINDTANLAISILEKNGIHITPEAFFGKYQNAMQFDYNGHIAMTLNAQAQIMAGFQQRQMMRGPQGYTSNPNQLDSEARSALSALYKDERTRIILTEAIKTCVLNIYNAILSELIQNNIFSNDILISRNKAAEIYASSFQNYNPDINKIVSAIFEFPGEKQYYDYLFWQLVAEESDDFERFLKFWGIDYFYPAIAEKRNASKDFDSKISNSGLAGFDYNNMSAENYVFLRQQLDELQLSDTMQYPEFSAHANYIKNYYQNICIYESLFSNPLYVSHIKKNVSLAEFVEIIKKERDALPINPYKSLWIYGDPVGDKVPLCPKQNMLQAVAYEGDNIVFNCPQGLMGGKGIMLTTKFVVDLSKNVRIPLANVVDIVYFGTDSIRITDGMQAIDIGKLPTPYINTRMLPNPQIKDGLVRSLTMAFINLIKIFCIRFGDNQILAEANPYLL